MRLRKPLWALKLFVVLTGVFLLIYIHTRAMRLVKSEVEGNMGAYVVWMMRELVKSSYEVFLNTTDDMYPRPHYTYLYAIDSEGKLLKLLRRGEVDATISGVDLSRSKIFSVLSKAARNGLFVVFSPFSERRTVCFAKRRGDVWYVAEVNVGTLLDPLASLASRLNFSLFVLDPEGRTVWSSQTVEMVELGAEEIDVGEGICLDFKGITLLVKPKRKKETRVVSGAYLAVPLFVLFLLLYEILNGLDKMEKMER